MTEQKNHSWNQDEIAGHLRSAVDSLTPNVLDKIDLSAPQEIYVRPSKVTKLYRGMRTAVTAAAACLCVVVLAGGTAVYQNSRIESVIGIDVNPSIELSVNRNEKVLKAEPLNSDAEIILDDMDLKNVDLDIAVNALVGSMVRNGYLDELDNAILVTVANDDKKKASVLRQDVVVDIEASLEEHEVQAVVYDQQAKVTDEVTELAKEYGISYGKAYFLQELIDENNLSAEEMSAFAGMTMEEIAREITERSYTVRTDKAEIEEESLTEDSSPSDENVTSVGNTASSEDSEADASEVTESSGETEPEQNTSVEASQPSNPSSESSAAGDSGNGQSETVGSGANDGTEDGENESGQSVKKAHVDYADYEDGSLNVVFKKKVKWKNPTVSVKDENGQSYSAMITDTAPDSCEIQIQGLPGGMECTFVLAGVADRDSKFYGSIKGYFDTPDIAEELEPDTEPDEETEEEPEDGAGIPENGDIGNGGNSEPPVDSADDDTAADGENQGTEVPEVGPLPVDETQEPEAL